MLFLHYTGYTTVVQKVKNRLAVTRVSTVAMSLNSHHCKLSLRKIAILCGLIQNKNPTKFEGRSDVRLLNANKVRPIEIYRQINEVYGESVMNNALVRKWCIMFNEGQTDVDDDKCFFRPSRITDELKKNVGDKIQEDTRFILDSLHYFSFPKFQELCFIKLTPSILVTKNLCQMGISSIV